jgi:hypothetical protein
MMLVQSSRVAALVMGLVLTGCAVPMDADNGEYEFDEVAADDLLVQPSNENIGEARDEQEVLSKYEICYKSVYASVNILCRRAHNPIDICRLLADQMATAACKRYL